MSEQLNQMLDAYYKAFEDYPTIVHLSSEEAIQVIADALDSGKPAPEPLPPGVDDPSVEI